MLWAAGLVLVETEFEWLMQFCRALEFWFARGLCQVRACACVRNWRSHVLQLQSVTLQLGMGRVGLGCRCLQRTHTACIHI